MVSFLSILTGGALGVMVGVAIGTWIVGREIAGTRKLAARNGREEM